MKSLMKTIPVTQAVGTVLCHDLTRIVPGESKGPAFRKGHIVTEEDIPLLLSMGKEHLYVFSPEDGIVHENDAAKRIAAVTAGAHLTGSEPSEGKITFSADCRGLLHVDAEALLQVNLFGEISFATLHTMQEVQKGQAVAGTRIIPLVIEEEKIKKFENSVQPPIIEVLPFRPLKVGIVTTGSEVYTGRIKDCFGPVLKEKFARYGCTVIEQIFTSDDAEMTAAAIRRCIEHGAELVACTGGMSVDPDDRTPAAIRSVAPRVVTYGTPTLPGAMFMLAYAPAEIGTNQDKKIPVVGLPGCVMYHKTTVFELIVPRILAGVEVTPKDIASLGHGGFCSGCAECRYPLCAFGKC